MPHFESRTLLPVPPRRLYDWHAADGAFERLTPPWDDVRSVRADAGLDVGVEREISIRAGGMRHRWLARHTAHALGEMFVDEQVSGPFAHWRHEHHFVSAPSGAELVDSVQWQLPGGALLNRAAVPMVRRKLQAMFRFRHQRTAMDLTRHAELAVKPLHVVISGASGLVGAALTAFLTTGGHTVTPLVRDRSRPGIFWDPERGEIDAAALEGVDAVVHLAGAGIADGRWTDARKQLILQSRTLSTKLLAESLARLQKRPSVFVSASAIGFYGNRPDGVVDESSARGAGFVGDVCEAWELAAQPAVDAGIRVVHPRLGIVLSARGGALAKMLPAFRAGAGGPIGNGRQAMSWVALDDVLGALLFVLVRVDLSGPVNVTAPNPVTNAEFGRTLGRVLHRPAVLPLPALAVKAMFGEMGRELLLEGARVSPRRLQGAGYRFAFAELESALRFELGA